MHRRSDLHSGAEESIASVNRGNNGFEGDAETAANMVLRLPGGGVSPCLPVLISRHSFSHFQKAIAP